MKNILLAALLFTSQAFAADTVIPNNKLKLGQSSSSGDKIIEFNTNSGSANPKIKVTPATNKIQFANDGLNFKDLGSGSGSGGGSGINLLPNAGFETGIADGWSNTGGTFAAVTSGINLLYQTTSASFVATLTGQFFESTAITVPQILFGQDCMIKVTYKGADANGYLTVLDGSNVELIPTSTRAILNSNSGIKTAKVYFNCPSTGSVKIRVRSTAAMAIGYFDEAVLGQADFTGVSAITSDVNYSPVYTGFGTPTAVDIKFSRVGKKLKIIGRFALGTTTAVTASIGLPNNWTVSNKYTSPKIFGEGFRLVATAATKNYSIIASANDTTLKISASGDTQTPNPITPILGTDIGSSGQEFTFTAELEINEFSESELVVNSKCPNDLSCENEFGAYITGSTGAVSQENLDWINGSCSKGGTGVYNCTYFTGIFSAAAPNCTSTIVGGVNYVAAVTSSGAASTTWQVRNSAGTLIDADFMIKCSKAGSDFKPKQNIQGFLSNTVTSDNSIRIEKGKFAGATDLTNCTASPCTVYRATSGVTSVTRAGLGSYSINFVAGTFSEVPTCSYGAANSATSIAISSDVYTEDFANVVTQVPNTVANTDSRVDFICIGRR